MNEVGWSVANQTVSKFRALTIRRRTARFFVAEVSIMEESSLNLRADAETSSDKSLKRNRCATSTNQAFTMLARQLCSPIVTRRDRCLQM